MFCHRSIELSLEIFAWYSTYDFENSRHLRPLIAWLDEELHEIMYRVVP